MELSADDRTHVMSDEDGTQVLEIESVQSDDQGTYTCVAVTADGQTMESKGILQVGAEGMTKEEGMKPEFTTPLNEVAHCKDGALVTLECTVVGSPRAQISWYKDGEEILDSQDFQISMIGDKCKLQILEVFPEDEGQYSCRAVNSAGETTTMCHVQVEGGSRAGEEAVELHVDPTTKKLTREKRSARDREKEKAPEFIIKPRRQFIDLGETAKFKASFEGSAQTKLFWDKNGTVIASDDKHVKIYEQADCHWLEICDVTSTDVGTYTCTIQNSAGSATATAELEVFERPKPVSSETGFIAPVVDVPISNTNFPVGEKNVSIECKFSNAIDASTKWLKDGKVLKQNRNVKLAFDGRTARLVLAEATATDAGKYECIATNSGGEAKTQGIFAIGTPVGQASDESHDPPIFSGELSDVDADSGDRVELAVKVKGTPPIDLIWVHNNRQISTDDPVCRLITEGNIHKLIIPNVSPDDSGEYVCEAYNDYGDTDTFCRINVREPDCNEPPEFVTKPRSVHVNVGNSAIFTCRYTGNPLPCVKWEKEGEIIQNGHKYKIITNQNNSSLEIQHVSAKDDGKYTCILSSKHGTVKSYVNLIVRDPQQTASQIDFRNVLKNRPGLGKIETPGSTDSEKSDLSDCEQQDFRSVLTKRSTRWPEPQQEKAYEVKQLDFRTVLGTKPNQPKNNSVIVKSKESPEKQTFQTKTNRVLEKSKESLAGQNFQTDINQNVSHLENSNPNLERTNFQKVYQTGNVQQNGHNLNDSVIEQRKSKGLKSDEIQKEEIGGVKIQNYQSALSQRREPRINGFGSGQPVEQSVVSGIRQNGLVSGRTAEHSDQKERHRLLSGGIDTKQWPRFKKRLFDKAVQSGSEVTLECEVIGVPKPEITWSINKKQIKPSKFFKMSYENNVARLVIAEAFSEDDGEYTCTASNAAGTSTCSCDIFVEGCSSQSSESHPSTIPPEVLPEVENSTVPPEVKHELPRILSLTPDTLCAKRGTTVIFSASFSGEPRPQVRWYRNRNEIMTDSRIHIKVTGNSSLLTIDSVQPGDGGRYNVCVENELGMDSVSSSINVEDVPEPPVEKPSVSNITSSSLTLSWSGPAYDGGSHVTHYQVEVCEADEQIWRILSPMCQSTSLHVMDLQSDTPYMFRVCAENRHGCSQPSMTSDVVVTTDRRRTSRLSEESDDELPFEHREVALTPGRAFEDVYEQQERVGKGRFGNVYKCVEKKLGDIRAAKVIKCREREKETLKREVEIMNLLRHPKLLMLFDAFEAPRKVILVMEYVGGGELFERIIDDDFVLTERDCVGFMRQICDGVCFMHSKSIIHLDLKPENILCIRKDSNQIKIIDFGLTRIYTPGESLKVLVGTPEFIAPEVVNYEEVGLPTDMWSIGVICYVLLSGLSPFMGDTEAETLSNVTRGDFDFEDDAFNQISDSAKEYIEKLLLKNKEKRLTVHQCLKHKWLAQDEKRMRFRRLNTLRLKQFMARRKWQKTGNAIRALGRIANLLRQDDNSGSESSTCDESDTSCTLPSSERSSVSSVVFSKVETDTSGQEPTAVPINQTDIADDSLTDSVIEPSPEIKSKLGVGCYDSETDSDCAIESGSPKFIKVMVDSKSFVGDVVRFDVKVTGQPDPKITWYHEDEEIHEDEQCVVSYGRKGECSLIIKNVTDDDEGEYACRAANTAGEVTCSAELIICGTGAF